MWDTCGNYLGGWLSRRRLLGMVPAVTCQACRREDGSDAPPIAFTRIPQADPANVHRFNGPAGTTTEVAS